ncbi:MAG: flagellar basal body-associated FliL family protein [Planctomycetes bacterium]|nr:flagellar basal body-associated FliL family protein [Planctomycetota bacterium]
MARLVASFLAPLLAASLSAFADEGPLVVREVLVREDGVYLRIAGAAPGALVVGATGSFREEVRVGDIAYGRTLARFEVVEAGDEGALARITARVEGYLPLPGTLVAPGKPEVPAPSAGAGEELAGVELEPFEIPLAEGGPQGGPKLLRAGIALLAPRSRAPRVASEVERSRREVRAAVLGVLLSMSRADVESAEARERAAETIRERVNRILLPAPGEEGGGSVLRVEIREWRLE